MRKRKNSLLQRMFAMLLAAVLITGMVSNAAPVSVLAQEITASSTPDGQQESGGENRDETVDEDTEPKGETSSEEQKPEEKPEQETPKPEEGTEEETPKPADGAEEETPKPKDETEQEIPEPEEEAEQETPGTGTEEETEETKVAEASQDLQALLARIVALPDAEEYLATEPDADDWAENEDVYEEAYTEWMVGLYEYADEALAIQEEIEKLPEEQRAQIPEEKLQKLAAWAELAQTAGESAQVMAAESSMVMTAAEPAPQADNITSGTDWVLDADGKLTIRSNDGMTDWVKNGRGKLHKNNDGEIKNAYECVTSVDISNGVTGIADRAFSYCENLKEITLPTGVVSIGDQAFSYCTNLTSITLPTGVISIGDSAFYNCTNLKEITLPVGVESIGDSAFYSCKKLTSITIPQSVKSIGDYVFGGCTNLETVTVCSDTPPACGDRIFYYSDNAKVYVPVCDYLTADGWRQCKSKIVPDKHGDISYSAKNGIITQKCGGCNTEYGTARLLLSDKNFVYTGEAITPVSVSYSDSGTSTWVGEKPTAVTYENNTNAGTATASLTLGTGENAATIECSFTIIPLPLTTSDIVVTLPADSFPYTGNTVTPEVTVKHGGTTLTKDTDYTVSYTNNSAVGTATVTVTGKGNYSLAVTKNFQIVESDADKVAAAKTVVENALNGITATNATTEAEILSVINAALGNAGITGVTVTIDKFRKTEATISAAGHIEGVVSITCGQESVRINMEKTIAKLTAGKYTAAVNNGTGGGEYAAGDTVTITANAPASGKQFDKWTVNSGNVTLTDATSSTTTFTMPAGAVSVTATYKDKTTTGGGDGGGDSGGNSGGNTGSGDYSGGSSGGNSDSSGSHSGGGSHGGGNSGNGNNNNDNGGFAGDADNNGAGGNINSGNGSSGANDAAGGSQSGVNAVVTPAKAPATVITTPQENLEDTVLTAAEKQQKVDGADIRIELDVKVAAAETGAADRTLVEEALRGSAAGYSLGQYLDISLYKVIGDSRTAITQTDGKITVRIDVPESLKNTDSTKTRTFAVIRAHDGKAQLLADLDQNADTITIETDRFSTYAIVYKDTVTGAGNPGSGDGGTIQLRAESGSGKDDEPKTGDNTPIELSATLAMIAGFGYLLLYFMDRERGMTEERKKELVSCLVAWAKQGGKIRKYMALAAIFVLLVYYHSIGKKTCVEWKEVYGE